MRPSLKIMIDNNNQVAIAAFLKNTDHNIHVNELFDVSDEDNSIRLETALTYALLHKKMGIVDLLLACDKVDLTLKNSNNDTAIILAARILDLTAYKQFVSHKKVKPHLLSINSVTGNNIIHDIILGYIDLKNKFSINIKQIIDRIAVLPTAHIDINLQNNNDEYPITILFNRLSQVSTRDAKLNIITDLIRLFTQFSHFNINVKDPISGMTPLMIAIQHDNTIAEYLCSFDGINVNILNDSHNDCALNLAIKLNHLPLVTRLANMPSCEINQANLQGDTPLMLAARGTSPFKELSSLLQAMMRRGIDLDAIVTEKNFMLLLRNELSFKAIHLLISVAKLSSKTLHELLSNVIEQAERVINHNPKRHAELVGIVHEIKKHKSFENKPLDRSLALVSSGRVDSSNRPNRSGKSRQKSSVFKQQTSAATRPEMLAIQAVFQLNEVANTVSHQFFSKSPNSAFSKAGSFIPSRRPLYSASHSSSSVCMFARSKANVPAAISIILAGNAQRSLLTDDATDSTATASTVLDDLYDAHPYVNEHDDVSQAESEHGSENHALGGCVSDSQEVDDRPYNAARARDEEKKSKVPGAKRLC